MSNQTMSNSTISSLNSTIPATVASSPAMLAVPTSRSQGSLIIGISAALLAGNVLFIGLRWYTKAAISRTFNYNEIMMGFAVLAYASLLALLILGVQGGIGNHTTAAGIAGIGVSLKYIFFLEIIYVLLTSVMKASLALTLLQWSKKRFHTFVLWTAIVIDAIICTFVVLFFLLQCQPISYAWELIDPTKKGKCLPAVDQIYVGIALSSTTISLDMIFLFIPFFMLVGRGVNTRLKLYIYGIFSLGVLASIANFIRLAALFKLKSSTDPLFDAAPVFLWSAVEVSIGISAAGIIELAPLMRKLHVKGFEGSFDKLDEDSDTRPIRLQSMDKNSIRFPTAREMRGP